MLSISEFTWLHLLMHLLQTGLRGLVGKNGGKNGGKNYILRKLAKSSPKGDP